jgi:hypothetical protein
MPKVQAWERLQDSSYCSQLNMGEFESLLLKAGYSPEVAHEAAMRRGIERLNAGVTM